MRKTRVAFRCQYCGAVITSDISRERLDEPVSLLCTECRKSKLDIKKTGETISLTVPCLMCPHPHPYKVSESIFFERDIFVLKCTFTGLDICFIGDEDNVEDEIDASGALISAFMEENKEDEGAQKGADILVADTSVMREVVFAIGEVQKQEKIKCSCGSKAFKVLLDYDKAVVSCKVCSRKAEIPARTRFDANAAIDLEEIVLE